MRWWIDSSSEVTLKQTTNLPFNGGNYLGVKVTSIILAYFWISAVFLSSYIISLKCSSIYSNKYSNCGTPEIAPYPLPPLFPSSQGLFLSHQSVHASSLPNSHALHPLPPRPLHLHLPTSPRASLLHPFPPPHHPHPHLHLWHNNNWRRSRRLRSPLLLLHPNRNALHHPEFSAGGRIKL